MTSSDDRSRAASMPRWRAYALEARFAALALWRTPRFTFVTLALPVLFYLLFGVVMRFGGADTGRLLLAGYTVFGLLSLGMVSFGAGFAMERDSGLLRLKQAQPMPPGAFLVAKGLAAMAFAAAICGSLEALAVTVGHVALSPLQAIGLLGLGLLGVLPFCAMGLLVGASVGGSAAIGLVNLIYLPMAFLSGIWIPLEALPQAVQRFAPVWPPYHLDRIALAVLGVAEAPVAMHVAALLGFTAIFAGAAAMRLRPARRPRRGAGWRRAGWATAIALGVFFAWQSASHRDGAGGDGVAAIPAGTATAPGSTPSPNSLPSGDFAVTDVNLFDGERVVPHASVIVRGGRIESAGAGAAVPPGLATVEGAGRTLLPGLIDSHVHAFLDARRDALRFGVTTELDMMNVEPHFADWRRQRERLDRTGEADLWSAGFAATAPGGHGTEYGFPVPTLARAADAAAFVEARVAEGSDYLKIMLDDGHSYGPNVHFASLAPDAVKAAIDAAHAHGRLAVAHVATLGDARMALESGLDGLAHMFFDAPADDAFVAMARERHLFAIATLAVNAGASRSGDAAALAADPAVAPWLSAAQRAALAASFPNVHAQMLPGAINNTRRLHAAGIPILAGTDAGNPGTAHGASLHEELALLVRAGLSPAEALAAATSSPTRIFSLGDRGRIAPGRRADLLLVDGDPTVDIAATRRIVAIWKNGFVVDRDLRDDEKQGAGAGTPIAAGSLLADFERGDAAASIGAIAPTSDRMAGGRSTVALSVVAPGADGSGHALRIAGEVADGFVYPWAGAVLMPGGGFDRAADLSAAKALRFKVRGDGHAGTLMVFAGAAAGGMPQGRQSFTPGADWQTVVVPLSSMEGVDRRRIRAIAFAATGAAGAFTFEIDDVEVR